MFFTPELLSQRESGFGLLWLAATLGSKSSFKKLPRRSVLTADISQLCGLIAEPEEPLALRLSSNLMVGVARVYKVKHEIFLADVTTCFNSLKKAISEISMASDAQLQMAQPSLRPETITLPVDPTGALALNFANMFMDWDENITDSQDKDDLDFDPTNKRSKRKKKSRPAPSMENLRTNLHILNEDHSHILSNSFDLSFSEHNSGVLGIDLSSQSVDLFRFEDDIFGALPDLDLGGDIGDELARELGEGWGGNDFIGGPMNVDQLDDNFGMDVNLGGHFPPPVDPAEGDGQVEEGALGTRKRPLSEVDKENRRPLLDEPLINPVLQSRQESTAPPETVGSIETENSGARKVRKKFKGSGLLLDERTELTADELKDARTQYMERQDMLRCELDVKRRERNCAQLFEQMLWAIPHDIKAPEIVEFWRLNLRVQMDARMGILTPNKAQYVEPPKKRRKTQEAKTTDAEVNRYDADIFQDADLYMNFNNDHLGDGENNNVESTRLRSSEEPGQGRHNSRPPSLIGSHLDIRPRGIQNETVIEAQKSALFPWDNAGVSSSSGFAFDFAGGTPVENTDVRLGKRHGSGSLSHRESSIIRSLAASPAQFGARDNRLSDEDFEFQLPQENSLVDTQPAEASLLALERNSFNFLEYAKMQLQTLPSTHNLCFDDVVPQATSTRHVAAAAFYHCLVLGTKHLVGLHQDQPYGNMKITIM